MKRKIIIERIPGPLASVYEKAAKMVIESYYSQVAEEVASNLKEGLILDLGTGPGYLPIEIVKRSPSVRIDGIDLSRKLIDMAQANTIKSGVANKLNFEVGNAARLRFKDCTYDMVITTGMLHTLKNPIKVLRECFRVLKRGGEAWIYDPARVSSQIDVKKFKASLTFLERFIYLLFPLYRLINTTHTYNRKEVIAMIAFTDFRKCWIKEEGDEIKIKLRK